MIATGKTFTNLSICLDGGTFKNCKFRNCQLAFHGLLSVTLDGCDFGEGVTWRFDGPASNVTNFLSALYAGGASELIENFFQQIRGQPIGSGPAPTFH